MLVRSPTPRSTRNVRTLNPRHRQPKHRFTSSATSTDTTPSMNSVFLQAQENMLRRFQEEKAKEQSDRPSEERGVGSLPEVNIQAMFNNDELIRAQRQLFEDLQKAQQGDTACKSNNQEETKELTLEKFEHSLKDSVEYLQDGRKVKLKGMARACRSVVAGTASIVQCPSCNMHMQVDPSAKAVYCIVCRSVFSKQEASKDPNINSLSSQAA